MGQYGGRVTAHEALKGYTAIRHFAADHGLREPRGDGGSHFKLNNADGRATRLWRPRLCLSGG